jgi:hypothetical protein
MERINAADIPYNPLSTNSNAAAYSELLEAGLPVPDVPWTILIGSPGWGTTVP